MKKNNQLSSRILSWFLQSSIRAKIIMLVVLPIAFMGVAAYTGSDITYDVVDKTFISTQDLDDNHIEVLATASSIKNIMVALLGNLTRMSHAHNQGIMAKDQEATDQATRVRDGILTLIEFMKAEVGDLNEQLQSVDLSAGKDSSVIYGKKQVWSGDSQAQGLQQLTIVTRLANSLPYLFNIMAESNDRTTALVWDQRYTEAAANYVFEEAERQRGLVEATTKAGVSLDRLTEIVQASVQETKADAREDVVAKLADLETRTHALLAVAALFLIAVAMRFGHAGVARPMKEIARAMSAIGVGDMDAPLPKAGRDEIGEMVRVVDAYKSTIVEAARAKAGLDSVSAKVTISDIDGEIIYANRAAFNFFVESEAVIQTEDPNFRAADLIGSNVIQLLHCLGRRGITAEATQERHDFQFRVEGRTFRVELDPVMDLADTPIGTVVEWDDLTEQIRREAAHLEATFEHMSQGVAVFDRDQRLAAFNPQFNEILGYPPDFLKLGMSREDIIRLRAQRGDYGDGDIESLVKSKMANPMDAKSTEHFLATGRAYLHEQTPMPDGGFISTATDITERKRAEQELAAQSALLETTIDTMAQGVVVYDREQRLVSFNRQYEKLMGFPSGFLHLGMQLGAVDRYRAEAGHFGPGDPEKLCQEQQRKFRATGDKSGERVLADGTAYIYDRKRLPSGGSVTTFTDLTQQKKTEEELERNAAILSTTVNSIDHAVKVIDGDGKLVLWNDLYQRMFQLPDHLMKVGTPYLDLARYIHEKNGRSVEGLEEIIAKRRARNLHAKRSTKIKTLREGLVVHQTGEPMPDGGFVSTYTDITPLRRAEEELAAKSAQMESTLETMSQGIAVFDDEFNLLHFNEHYANLFKFPPGFLRIGMNWQEIARHRAERGQFSEGGDISRYRSEDGHKDDGDGAAIGREHIRRFHAQPERTSERSLPDGTVYVSHRKPMPGGGVVTTYTDVTERKEAEKAHVELTEQLYQSQKMDAIGQLAGGVAHDFNNILMVMDGYTRLASKDPDLSQSAKAALEKVLQAAGQAAGVTKQLLVFSRRQALETKVVKAGSILPGMDILLRPLLGETIDLRIANVEEDIYVATDVAQLNQALVNLAINARDAMPAGGGLSIFMGSAEADDGLLSRHPDLSPGTYLRIDVEDRGQGMDKDTLASLFDPFFTTKEQGKGTGLGLAMVHGFVRQSKGAIEVESTLGRGTLFSIYLPTTDAPMEVAVDIDDGNLAADGETILLAEDNDDLRGLVQATLQGLGYTVLTACDGLNALEVEMDHDGPIDLLLSDIVMPTMGGIELAKALEETRPDTKVLLMSGYPSRGEIKQMDLPEGVPLIRKPCPPEQLVRAVRDAIEDKELV